MCRISGEGVGLTPFARNTSSFYHITKLKLVPKQLELNALRQREEEALKRCLQAREKRDEETLEARITQLNEKHTKLDEQGRQNFELLNGRFDEIEKIVRGK